MQSPPPLDLRLLWIVPLLLGLVIHAAALVGPPLVDLLRRHDERVGLWWVAPLGVLGLDIAGGLGFVLVAFLVPGRDYAAALLTSIGLFTVLGAFALAGMTVALAFVRGITPGGETERPLGAWLKIGGLALALVAVIALGVLEVDEVAFVAWMVPAWWTLQLWGLGLDRRGPPRLENARRTGAGWMAVATFWLLGGPSAGVMAALTDGVDWLRNLEKMTRAMPVEAPVMLGCWAALLVGVYAYSRPWPWWSLPVGLAWVPLVFFAPLLQVAYFEVPPWLDVVERVDLRGEPVEWGVAPRRHEPQCIQVHGWRWGCSPRDRVARYYPPDHVYGEEAKHTHALVHREGGTVELGHYTGRAVKVLAVDPPTRGPDGRLSLGDRVEVREPRGSSRILPLAELEGPQHQPLVVHGNEVWTVQDAVSICATLRASRCVLGAPDRKPEAR